MFCLLLFAAGAHSASGPFLSLTGLYAGAHTIALDCRNCQDLHVSDWRYYGTGPSEGRVNVNLDAFADPGRITFGVVGAEFSIPHAAISCDLGFTLAEDNSGFITCGVSHVVRRFGFGAMYVKFLGSYEYLNLSAGPVESIPGKMDIVYAEPLRIQGDEEMIFESYAVKLGGGVCFSIPVGPRFRVILSPVVHRVAYRNYSYRIGEQNPTWDSEAYLEPEPSSYKQVAQGPGVTSWGYSLLVTLEYILNLHLLE